MEHENTQAGDSILQEKPPVRSRKTPILVALFFLLLILLVGGTYFIYGRFRLPGERLATEALPHLTPTPSISASSNKAPKKWQIPEYYLASDGNGNILSGTLKGNKERMIAKTKGKILGAPQFQALSKSGKYFLYIQLPDAVIAEFQKNPPYEFHGSTEYELHLVTIGEDGKTTDEVVDTNVRDTFLEGSVFAFDKDEKGFFYPKYENEKDVTYFFRFADSTKNTSSLPAYLQANAALSPTGLAYVLLEALPKDQSDTSVNNTYNLNLYAVDGTKKKTLYANFISGEYTVIFPSENAVYLAREDYVDGPNSICYIEKISVPDGEVSPLRAQECPPGFSNTNYHDLSLSPDGKLLLAQYTQDGPGDTSKLANFFMYDLKSGASQTIAEMSSWYGKYSWVDNREVITTTINTTDQTQKPVIYRVNLTTGEASPDDTLSGKAILGVY